MTYPDVVLSQEFTDAVRGALAGGSPETVTVHMGDGVWIKVLKHKPAAMTAVNNLEHLIKWKYGKNPDES